MKQLINHIVFILDASGSMDYHKKSVPKQLETQLRALKNSSEALDQETRVSVYTFDSINQRPRIDCQYFDRDIDKALKLKISYDPDGGTPLLHTVLSVIREIRNIPESHGDHAFLFNILTDGEETDNKDLADEVKKVITRLPDNWTVAVQVPNQTGVFNAKRYGFPAGNIETWDASSSEGLEYAAQRNVYAMNNFYAARATGVRGSSTYFTTDLSAVTKQDVKSTLTTLSPKEYSIHPVRKESRIDDFVSSWTGRPYITGSGYYELMKREEIQNHKAVVLQDRANGKCYGGDEARKILNLPDYTVKVSPGDHGKWKIFVQSKAPNRKLLPGTELLIMK
jgi:uncharacterized protein (DUF58 family)